MIYQRQKTTRIHNKFQYHLEDMECKVCAFFGGKKNGCQFSNARKAADECCCENEKREAIENGKLKRKKGVMAWVG